MEDIKKNGIAYEKNFELLIKAHDKGDKKAHNTYLKRERELENEGVKIRKALGVYVSDPCPLQFNSKTCENCTGYWYEKKGEKIYLSLYAVDRLPKNTEYYQCRLCNALINNKIKYRYIIKVKGGGKHGRKEKE